MFKKNTAVTGFMVGLRSSTDGSDITTGTPVGYYCLDGGTQTAIGDTTPTHEGNGLWSFDLTAAEMNGDVVALTFTHTSAITEHFIIKTDTKLVSELQDLTAAQVNTECDTALTDYDPPTNAEMEARTLLAANYFDSSTDTVTVGTNNDKAGYSLSQTFPANFADLSITATTGLVNLSDKTGFSISGTITTLDGLNNFNPATDTVANVTTVATCTTNTDMRGTENAALAANLATAQADLDIITGSDGVIVASSQGAITWGAVTISVADAVNNITLAGSGTGDGLAFTRTGAGDLYETNWAAAITGNTDSAITANASIVNIEADTNELQTDDIPTLIAALPTAAEINAEVVDVLETDTHAEPTSTVGATASIKDAVMWNKTVSRNKMTQTSATTTLRNDADNADIASSTVSDDGTTFTKGKFT